MTQDLEELLLDAFFSDSTTALSSSQIVCLLHPIVSEGTLKPLNKIKDAGLIVAEIHSEVKDVKTC